MNSSKAIWGSIFVVFSIPMILLSFAAKNTMSQCAGVYQEPIAHRVFSERVFFGFPVDNPVIDLTGDGILDLVGVGYGPSNQPESLVIYPGNGDLTFGNPEVLGYPANTTQLRPRFVDYDSDGFRDVIFEFQAAGTLQFAVSVNINDGSGNFVHLATSSLGANEILMNTVDLNGDNLADLVVLGESSVFYRPGNPDGSFGAGVLLNVGFSNTVGDFDGDGSTDFVASVGAEYKVFFNDGCGVFSPGAGSITLTDFPEVADLNNDGKSDLYSRDLGNNNLIVWLSQGNGSFNVGLYFVPAQDISGSTFRFEIADLNGDSFEDFISFSYNSPFYNVLTNDGTGKFTDRLFNSYLDGVPSGDFDNDGKADFISYNNLTLGSSGRRLFNETQIIINKNSCNRFGHTKIVDFNRDGQSDKTLWNEGTGYWRFKNSNLAAEQVYRWGTNGDVPVPGDFDGDRLTDLAVFRPSDGVWYIYDLATNTYSYTHFGSSSDKPVPADYDGDGKTDIAVYRPAEGNWYVLSSSTDEVTVFRFGLAEDIPLAEDYDGDGSADVAVFRPSTGVWYVLRTSDGGYSAAKWGLGTDIPVPNDYDGDGKADLTVFRPSDGNWYILRSLNYEYSVFHFGLEGDVPQPGDWDRDGIVDLGVYRPSTNEWYTYNTDSAVYFGSSDETPVSYFRP